MMSIWKPLGAVALIAIAALLHDFYVPYDVNGDHDIFKGTTTTWQQETLRRADRTTQGGSQ